MYLALGKAKFALLDLDKVLELKPDFYAARLQRGNVLLKQAELDLAEIDYHNVVRMIEILRLDSLPRNFFMAML